MNAAHGTRRHLFRPDRVGIHRKMGTLRPMRMALWLCLPLVWILATPAAAQAPRTDEVTAAPPSDAPEIHRLLRQFDEMYESTGTTGQIEITVIRPKKTRTLRLRSWSKGDDKALLIVDAPARDAGTATLRVGSNLWNYLPKISRTIRVPPSLMMGSWMGSDLTNDDLVHKSSYEEDYTSEIIGRATDPPGWKVRLDARPGVAGLWNRVEVVFSFDDELPVQAHYFDRKDRHSRTLRFEDVKDIGGRRLPTHIIIVPEREEGRRTEMRYLRVQFDVDIDESMFSLSQLERSH
jgi:outer membrane lipoprotein-sorting protein